MPSTITLVWNNESIPFDSLLGIGEQVKTLPVIYKNNQQESWIQTLAGGVEREPIRLLKKVVGLSSAHFNRLAEMKKTPVAYLEIENEAGFQMKVQLTRPEIIGLEMSNIKSDETPYFSIEIGYDDLLIESIWGAPLPTEGPCQSKAQLTASLEISAELRKKEFINIFQQKMESDFDTDIIKLEPHYLTSEIVLASKLTLDPHSNQPTHLATFQNALTFFSVQEHAWHQSRDETLDVLRKRRETLSLEFFVYKGCVGDFANSENLIQGVEGLFYSLFFAAPEQDSFKTGKAFKYSTFLDGSPAKPKVSAVDTKTGLPQKLLAGAATLKAYPSERPIVPQLFSYTFAEKSIFIGSIYSFRYEVDQFDTMGEPTRMKVSLDILGVRELNAA